MCPGQTKAVPWDGMAWDSVSWCSTSRQGFVEVEVYGLQRITIRAVVSKACETKMNGTTRQTPESGEMAEERLQGMGE